MSTKKPKDFNRDAELIWGGVPTDIEWALNTSVYKNLNANNAKRNSRKNAKKHTKKKRSDRQPKKAKKKPNKKTM